MLKNYIKITVRNLFSNKLFTTVNILGLSIGIATTLLIFVWVQNEWSFDDYHKDSDQIYRVVSHIDASTEVWNWASIPYASLTHIEQLPEVSQIALMKKRKTLFKIKQQKVFEEKNLALINRDWFEVFDYEILAGNIKDFTSNIHSIALTQRQAKKYFGTEDVLGENIMMDSIPYQINLILADPPANSSFTFDAYIPLESTWTDEKKMEKQLTDWGNYDYRAFLKIANPSIRPDLVAEKLKAIFDEYKRNYNNAFSLEAITDIRFSQTVRDDFQHQNKAGVYIFALIGFIILLVAGLNYVNLSSALVSQRVKEIGIKK
ncbi:MAG: ABC transporter permease, partial [Bacteroidota bacterium]